MEFSRDGGDHTQYEITLDRLRLLTDAVLDADRCGNRAYLVVPPYGGKPTVVIVDPFQGAAVEERPLDEGGSNETSRTFVTPPGSASDA